MDFSGEKNAAYSFLFNGPEDKKREFMICVQSYGLGEEAQKESKKETVQEYLKDAENLHQMGNEEAAFLRYKIAAEEYGDAHAQYKLARWYQDGIGVEPNEQKAIEWYRKAGQNGSLEAQTEMIRRCENGIGMEKSRTEAVAVSYTHLTLPTKRIVEISVDAVLIKKKKQRQREMRSGRRPNKED